MASKNKTLLAKLLGISRQRIYYHKTLDQKDLLIKDKIKNVHKIHPAYGHRRVAMDLAFGKNRILRIMRKFGLKPPRRKARKVYLTRSTDNHHYTNLIKNMVVNKPNQIYVSDLTYLKFQRKNIYLATVEDIFTREIVSAQISDKHDSNLALTVIKGAVNISRHPEVFHTDQGSEFMAQNVTGYLEQNGVKVSVSDKGSPWQNGYKESFFGRFKDENGDLNRFETLGELVEEIYSSLYDYNHFRIHTILKMAPFQFKQKFIESLSQKRVLDKKLLEKGIQQVFELETIKGKKIRTTEEHPYLVYFEEDFLKKAMYMRRNTIIKSA